MKKLNRALLSGAAAAEKGGSGADFPERVVQFGEGNFLRAFVGWMVHRMNRQGLFNGRVAVVQPIADGLSPVLNEQDGLYTLLLRGLENGSPVERRELIESVSRGINPYEDYEAFAALAGQPEIEFIVSNTTEAGIAFDPADRPGMRPPRSFPGKLTAFLFHRFERFGADPSKGLVILPCELIDRNGDNLRRIVLQLAGDWGLPADFRAWVEQHHLFLNTLVDRVVTGYPRDEADRLRAELGYEDRLIDTGELFHLWVIEAPEGVAERLPLTAAGLNVVWTKDMTPYRTRKVRILNGAHTACVPAAFLHGLETVGEMMDDPVMGRFIRAVISEEIIPSIGLDKGMLTEFADAVVERFRNPYIKHQLTSILLNSSSKFRARVLPSILEYRTLNGVLPERLVFSLAALITVYRGPYCMRDDLSVLETMVAAWKGFDGTEEAAFRLADRLLADTTLWGEDLTQVPGLVERCGLYLHRISARGVGPVIRELEGIGQ